MIRTAVPLCALMVLTGCAVSAPTPDKVAGATWNSEAVAHPPGFSPLSSSKPGDPKSPCATISAAATPPPTATSTSGEPWEARGSDKVLTIGVGQSTQLLSERNLEDGSRSGFEVGIANRVGEQLMRDLGPKVTDYRLVSLPTSDRLIALDTVKNAERRAECPGIPTVDVVIASLTVSKGREAEFGIAFSSSYATTRSGLLIPKYLAHDQKPGDKIVDDSGGERTMRVCTGNNTTNAEDLLGKTPDVDPEALYGVDDTSSCLALLQQRRVDAVYSDVLVLKGFMNQLPGTKLSSYNTHVGATIDEYAMATSNQDCGLLRAVNRALEATRDHTAADFEKLIRELPSEHQPPDKSPASRTGCP
ncbi:transporter substrate-binding domain-containing protein [Actinosynnema sp. NPDC050436]|uniref:transporter substrate-binding domain-containing protein n=1 Tax=Actinosynnema sp. NPDC050436 TaxID=3155659 RepID=UPI0033CB02A1